MIKIEKPDKEKEEVQYVNAILEKLNRIKNKIIKTDILLNSKYLTGE